MSGQLSLFTSAMDTPNPKLRLLFMIPELAVFSLKLLPVFSNNFKPAFYKQLHKYVHKSYRKQIAINNLKRFIKNPLAINAPMFKKVLSSLYYIPATMYEHHKLTILEKA